MGGKKASAAYRRYMLVPAFTRMWIVHVALSFESFFDCLESQAVHRSHWSRGATEIVFSVVALSSLLGASMCCSKAFVAQKERELEEELEEQHRHRSQSMMMGMSADDEWVGDVE